MTRISDAEWRVAQVVWERAPIVAADVVDQLQPETGWNHRTVRTLLNRLVKKGVLKHTAEGNRYVYRPKLAPSKCIREATQSFVDKVFGGDAASLLLHFVDQQALSTEQLAELQRLLQEKLGRKGKRK